MVCGGDLNHRDENSCSNGEIGKTDDRDLSGDGRVMIRQKVRKEAGSNKNV